MKSCDLTPIGVARWRQRRAQRQRVARVETLLLLLCHPRETFGHQTCPDQQHERQRDFGNDQRLAQALSPGAPAVAPAALFERFVEVGLEDCSAGTRPKTTLLTSETTRVKIIARSLTP